MLASVFILPGAMMNGEAPFGRFLYSALPFVSILFAVGLVKLWSTRARLLLIAPAVVWVWLLSGFWFSGTVSAYRTTTSEVETVVDGMQAEAAKWPDGAIITILEHPHPGVYPWRWVYAQHLAYLFVPEKHVTISLDSTPKAAFEYRFASGRLIPTARQDSGAVAGGGKGDSPGARN